MQITKHHKKIEEYGHHILYNRTKVEGVEIGDKFVLHGLKHTHTVSFFFKDRFFPSLICACCLNDENDCMLLIAPSLIKKCMPAKKVEQPIKRQRRSLFNL